MNMNKRTNIYCLITVSLVAVLFIVYFKNFKQAKPEDLQSIPDDLVSSENINVSTINNCQLFDLRLTYLINSNTCQNLTTDILAIIIVTSYFGNVETRSAMRRAFPNERLKTLGLRRVFLLGMAPKDRFTSSESIKNEAKRFGDLVQGNFIEAYRNLTYKHMMGMKWVDEYCAEAKYIIKMDDDIVVNLVEFIDVLKNLTLPRNSIAGYILRGMKPIREPYNKWYVTNEEFSGKSYPTFVSGWLYVTTPKVFHSLLQIFAVIRNKYFWIDDLFVTGILAKKLRLRHYDIGKYFAVHSEYMECCLRDMELCHWKCDFLIGPNGGDNNLFYEFNKAVRMCGDCVARKNRIEQTCVAEKKVNLGKGNAIIESYKLH